MSKQDKTPKRSRSAHRIVRKHNLLGAAHKVRLLLLIAKEEDLGAVRLGHVVRVGLRVEIDDAPVGKRLFDVAVCKRDDRLAARVHDLFRAVCKHSAQHAVGEDALDLAVRVAVLLEHGRRG